MAPAGVSERPPHPVAFDVAYPARLSRLTTLFRLVLVIPQVLAVWLLVLALEILTLLGWFAILFTGRYPRGFFEFTSGVLRWEANVFSYAALLRDEYPPFSWEPGAYPLALEIPYAERQSRFRLFIRVFAIVPNYIALGLVMLGWYFTTFMAWWAILITGRYPRGLFKFSVGVGRWQMRLSAYLWLLRDEYPPYSVTAQARPGNEVLSAIIGLPLFAGYVAFSLLPLFDAFGASTTAYTTLSPATISRDQPSARSGSLRITLVGYDDNAGGSVVAAPAPGDRFISFRMRGEKDGFLPASYWPLLFSLQTCAGYTYAVDTNISAIPFRVFWGGGSKESTVYFEIPLGATPCRLSYFTGRGRIRFVFR
ncbi:MAG TPA: DUF4389 domain-containing protein [Dehalococcoidia bacterium]|nr:DUF4389 domain-containing protein [Dehalococcoidia bacterium]